MILFSGDWPPYYKMADIAISIAAKVMEYLFKPTIQQGKYLFGVGKIIRDLDGKKKEMALTRDSVQNRVEEAKKKTEKIEIVVEMWLGEVKSLLEEVENLEHEMRENINGLPGCCPNLRKHYLSKQMVKKTKALMELTRNSKFESFSHPATLPSIEYFSSGHFTYFESTKSAYNLLLEAIQDDGSYVIGLYGMGGCGKTTLVKEMGKKAKDLNLFDQVVFATVSQTPNVGRIQDEIADFLGLTLVEKREPGRARRISLRLQDEERILLILDDVWARLSLEDIGIPLNADPRSFKVLLTTRRQQVCTLMECQRKIPLYLLSEPESWILLQKHACIDHDSSTSLLNGLVEGVVKECKGLPLAIETVGMSLRGKSVHEWKIAFDRLKNSKPLDIEEGVRDIFACLQLSYDYLGSKLAKSLFLMCGLFPEEHKIPIEDLFRFGVGLGFCGEVESFDIARSQVIASISKLIDSCLLMHCEESKYEVKMHDVVRDVALWIASQEDCVINVNQAKARDCFAMSSWYKKIDELPNQLDAPKLEVLLIHTLSSLKLSNATFEGIKGLKVMALVCGKDNERLSLSLPLSIHTLTNLRTLTLVGWKLGDISSVVRLKGLEILDLHRSGFKEVPNGIEDVNKLKLLDLSECEIEEDCYGVIARCSQLEELYVFGRDRNFGSIDSHECLQDSSNYSKLQLQRYVLQIGPYKGPVNVNLDEKCNPRILYIEEMNTSTLSTTTKDLLQRAEEVYLGGLCGGCKNVLPTMFRVVGGMNQLTSLTLNHCSELESIVDTISDQADADLLRLDVLELKSMDNMKELCHGPPLLTFFQNLRRLDLWKCQRLHNIFPRGCNLCNLEVLEVYDCPMLVSLFPMSVARTLQLLQDLSIDRCCKLEQIIVNEDEEISQVSKNSRLMFPKLKTLFVDSSDKLEHIFPIRCAQGLVQLESINIGRTSELKYIFGQHENWDGSSYQNQVHIELPLLKEVRLQGLPNLLSISPHNSHLRWPSLKEMDCEACPNFSTSGINI